MRGNIRLGLDTRASRYALVSKLKSELDCMMFKNYYERNLNFFKKDFLCDKLLLVLCFFKSINQLNLAKN